MDRDRWENIIGGIIVFIVLLIFGMILIWLGQWPFGWFWMIMYSIIGGLGYIALMYPLLGDVKKREALRKRLLEKEETEQDKFRKDWYNNQMTDDGPYK